MQSAQRRNRIGLYTALTLLSIVSSAGITVIYSMLSVLYRHFPDASAIGWVVTIYWLVSAIAAALCGRLGDLMGRRKITLWVLGLCMAGALIAALAASLEWMIVGCAIQGLASALTPLAFGILRENLDAKSIPFAVGLLSAVGMISAGVIYLSAGVVIDHYSWQGGFWFKLILALAAMLAVYLAVHHSEPKAGQRVSLFSGLLFAPGLAALLVVVQKGAAWGWDAYTWGLLAAGVGVLLVWGRQQWQQPAPLIDLRLLANRQVIRANLCMVCIGMGCVQIGQVMSLYLQQPGGTLGSFGLSATGAGLSMLCINLFSLIGGPLSGRIAARRGARSAAIIGLSIASAAWAAMLFLHATLAATLACAVLSTIGFAFAHPAVYNLIIEATPAERTSETTGVTYVFFACAFALGAQMIFTLLASDHAPPMANALSLPSDLAYMRVFGYVLVMTLAGLAVAFTLPKRPAKEQVELALAE
ncbi:MFS transporter [Pseudomonas sp. SJZ103]|uniref:MFS transporter n=1 Tax=unclassified Pseudomonas TaxID=196821 RepID=UPI0011A65767|nr:MULTISPECIES: MFS transporter [unclassified Pseudomonas]MBB6290713.1 MFS family permease [Pseudomonas sp. SJZ073]MBB6315559.1 MFS family permease [Pseudomonas sp. JAI120]TWC61580.1 MFS transporter [Pseudomonas sp. SJZ103]TWC78776.1 MFS transporter [Pseudomonas sp. SJZ094]